jgi:hypothetical protein
MLWRSLSGSILGASMCTAVTISATVLLLGFRILLFDSGSPVDRAGDVKRLIEFLPTAAMAGLVGGAVGGLASRLPRKGLRMVTSIEIVAGCAALARLPSSVRPRDKGSPEPSYASSVIAALASGAVVAGYGFFQSALSEFRSPPSLVSRITKHKP